MATERGLQERPLPQIEYFSPEARDELEDRGFIIYSLTCRSIRSLKAMGYEFGMDWHERYADLETLPSRNSEVAFNPAMLFLPRSNKKTLVRQRAMIAKYSTELAREVPDVEAVMGEAPDYAELAFIHFDRSHYHLFGSIYGLGWARTVTRVGSMGKGVVVGRFLDDGRLFVDKEYPDEKGDSIWAVPLIVPSKLPEVIIGSSRFI